jgi:hypothetical protein
MRTILLTAMLLTMAVVADAQWAYITPPWNFDHHPKYDGRTARSIPPEEWEQLAAFDSAATCEKGRLFARTIRNLSPNNREYLLVLFASGAEEQARFEANRLLVHYKELWGAMKAADTDVAKFEKSEHTSNLKMVEWWQASKCVSVSSRQPR